MTPSDLPPPDTIVEYPNDEFGPLMFHYATENCARGYIAKEQGYDCMFLHMDHDLSLDDPIYSAYFDEGSDKAVGKWQPTKPGDGWKLVGKCDTDDGPVATFIRAIGWEPSDGQCT